MVLAEPRRRAPRKGGYVRTTVTIPTGTHKKFRAFLRKNPGLSMSAFLTNAGVLAMTERSQDADV